MARVPLPLFSPLAGGHTVAPKSVRLSLTDRCDLACVYCRPSRKDGYFEERLDLREWETLISGLVRSGIRRVRITGGEPLLSPLLLPVLSRLAEAGLDDLALTTNATRLAELALPLREAGLQRITISLDSLDAHRFFRLTRGGSLSRVLAGIEAACRASFDEVKLNTVVLRGENLGEVSNILDFAWQRGITPRFIELMAVGEGARLAPSGFVPTEEVLAPLEPLLRPGHADQDPNRGPARYRIARSDPTLRVGFITGTSHTYCDTCDRLRVLADGTLRPCLATSDGVTTKRAVAARDIDGVSQRVHEAWARKPDGNSWKGCTETSAASVSMRQTGG